MRAALVRAGHEQGLRRGDLLESVGGSLRTFHLGRVGLGAEDHEVVVQEGGAVCAVTFFHELLLVVRAVHPEDIRLAGTSQLHGLAGAHGYGLESVLAVLLKSLVERVQQAGVAHAGGGGQPHHALRLGLGAARQQQGGQRGTQQGHDIRVLHDPPSYALDNCVDLMFKR